MQSFMDQETPTHKYITLSEENAAIDHHLLGDLISEINQSHHSHRATIVLLNVSTQGALLITQWLTLRSSVRCLQRTSTSNLRFNYKNICDTVK